MDDKERLHLQEMINSYDAEDNTSKIRKSDINKGTCFLMLLMLDNKHIGIRKVDKTTNGRDIPSTPI